MTEIQDDATIISAIASAIRTARENSADETAQATAVYQAIVAGHASGPRISGHPESAITAAGFALNAYANDRSLGSKHHATQLLDTLERIGYLTVLDAVSIVGGVMLHDQDEVHDSLCACGSYPQSCVTYTDLEAALPDRVYPDDVATALLAYGTRP